jgi:hypothetical protein
MTIAVRTPRTNWADVLGARKTASFAGLVEKIEGDNRRWANRRASASAATLTSPNMGDALTCVVLDTSSTGVRIKPHFSRASSCQTLSDLPKTLTLVFTIDRVAIDCKIAWRRDKEVGLTFISPARTLPKPPPRPMIGGKKK